MGLSLAFELACQHRFDDAVFELDNAIHAADGDIKLRGYLKQQAAAYTHFSTRPRPRTSSALPSKITKRW